MSPWPPSPSVEDEVTALSHEHTKGVAAEMVKSEDDPVVSRGSVDQYPIIVDSDDQRKPLKTSAGKSTKREHHVSEENSSDDSAGPTTPPPLSARLPIRPDLPSRTKSVSFEEPISSAKSSDDLGDSLRGRGRPQVTRIETGLGGDLHSMATGSRRAPSPYSYSRSAATAKPSPVERSSFLTPDNFTASPTQTPTIKQPLAPFTSPTLGSTQSKIHAEKPSQRRQPSKGRRYESESGDETKPTQEFLNSTSSEQRPARHSLRSDTAASQQDGYSRSQIRNTTMTPPLSRRGSRDLSQFPTGEALRAAPGTVRANTDSNSVKGSPHGSPFASPYTSSAEESHKRHHYRRSSGKYPQEESSSRRPSSHRKERPCMDDFVERSHPRRLDDSTFQGSSTQVKTTRPQSHLAPTTPLTADAAKSIEEYFEKALKDTDRRPRHGLSVRTSGSAITSPLTSPPRTPRSERQSKDYFESNTSQRPYQRSRPPSMDEGNMMELKAHATLLSAATTGAAKAARASGEFCKSGSSSAEQSSGNTTSRPPSVSGSRRPSPVFEDSRASGRSGSYVPMEKSHTAHPSATVVTEVRPTSRGSIYVLDHPPHPQIQRAFSYAGHEKVRSNNGIPSNTFIDQSQSPNAPAVPTYPVIPPGRTRALDASTEVKPMSNEVLMLPSCPRSQPSIAYNDWWTIKEMSDIDICPTCVSIIGSTRFRDFFVRSLPRPYNEPSVCAMSKPWLRVAFLQSLRQGRSNLDCVKKLSALPSGARPCAVDKPDMRMWFDIYDTSIKEAVPNFVACSACVYAVDSIFPELENVLGRPKGARIQEKVCSLNVNSKHFASFVDQLEKAASRCKGRRWRQSDIQPLVDHVRQATRYGDCAKDRMLSTRAWHFMPDLPELAICEQCYFDVVWPLRDKPIARDVSKTMKLVPLRSNSGVSCQLYSERMRRIFCEAVMTRNMSQLSQNAKQRLGIQQRLVEMNKLYEQDQKYGIDRRAEIERNNAIWHQWE